MVPMNGWSLRAIVLVHKLAVTVAPKGCFRRILLLRYNTPYLIHLLSVQNFLVKAMMTL